MFRESDFLYKFSKIQYKGVNDPNCGFWVIIWEQIWVIFDNKNVQNYHINYPNKRVMVNCHISRVMEIGQCPSMATVCTTKVVDKDLLCGESLIVPWRETSGRDSFTYSFQWERGGK